MKKVVYIITLFLVLYITGGLVSCQKEDCFELESDEFTTVEVNLQALASSATSDPIALKEEEYIIRRARLYAFDGNKLDNMVYISNLTTNNLGAVQLKLKVKRTASKTLYAILNEPERLTSSLALINHPAAFDKIEYQIADYMSKAYNTETLSSDKNYCLPMFGQKEAVSTIPVGSESAVATTMAVTRSLARVDVMLQKQSTVTVPIIVSSSCSFSILNTTDRGMIAPSNLVVQNLINMPEAAPGPQVSKEIPVRHATDNSKAIHAFTFYTPERVCVSEESKLRFQIKNLNYNYQSLNFEVTIGNQPGNTLTKIERNKVHRIYCTFTPKEVSAVMDILNWEDKEIIGEVGGSRITVSESRILMDWAAFNKSFTTRLQVIADGNISFEGFEYNRTLTTTGTNLPTWLPLSNITGLPNGTSTNATISLTYIIDNSVNKQPVYLCFRTGNITKKVEIVYDNGYLPNRVLSSSNKKPWLTGLPTNGIQISKKGNRTPQNIAKSNEITYCWSTDITTNTLEISRESSGAPNANGGKHGRGVYNTNWIIYYMTYINTAARKCRELGNSWYLPSSDELYTVSELKDYLGESYQIRTNSFWTSSAVVEDYLPTNSNNMYAGVIIIEVDNSIKDNFYSLKTQNISIRCLRNY